MGWGDENGEGTYVCCGVVREGGKMGGWGVEWEGGVMRV